MVIENFPPLLRKLDFALEFSLPSEHNSIELILRIRDLEKHYFRVKQIFVNAVEAA
jgi:hypothetical protein